jgi:8-oxo-dGTP pyrophosphatase MutT (NUDIX family)
MSPYYASLREKIGNDLLLIPSVAAVVHDESGRVLIQQRTSGGFSLPAGAIEPGESPIEAIVREVREETGLIVRPRVLLGVFGGRDGYRVCHANGHIVEYTVCLFACAISSGVLGCRDGESAGLRFYSPDAVPPLGTEYPRPLLIAGAEGLPVRWDER